MKYDFCGQCHEPGCEHCPVNPTGTDTRIKLVDDFSVDMLEEC